MPDNAEITEYEQLRKDWHLRAKSKLAQCKLIFFDPDVGVRENLVHGVVRGSEHARIAEINDYDWCDWLVIQFFRPKMNKYEQLYNNPITKSAQERNKQIVAFIAGPVAFLYLTDGIDLEILRKVYGILDTKISTQILIPSGLQEGVMNRPQEPAKNVCPECLKQFKKGWIGIDAHWRAKHKERMPYEKAWPLIRSGRYDLEKG